ncbi:MAG TPA: multidrug ABC transporter ATP-binding protein [Firmicutes bacterium]|nr:multidrug ABC transporter ATP-binding protein [Bacillota bacterium]
MGKLFKNLRKKEIVGILIALILIVVQVWLELTMPDYMSEITRLVQTEGSLMKDIIKEGALMLGCAFGSLIASVIVCYLAANIASSFATTIRSKIFRKIQEFGTEEIKKFSTSSLITRTTNDVTQVDMIIGLGLQMMVKAPIMAVWAVLKILNKGFEWSLLTGACVVILLATVSVILVIVLPRFERVQKLIDRINGVTRENLTGIRVIRAFNAEEFQQNRFEEVNNDLTNQQLFNQKTFAVMMPIMNLVMHGLTLGIYIIGTILILKAGMMEKITLFSNMVVFSSYGMQVIMSFLMLAMIFMMVPRAKISARRINEVLDENISVIDGTFTGETKEKGTVEFKNVSFKYSDADEYLLKNISFKVEKGETIAFIGSTGSGKSSLINLIPRFYDATKGEVLVDGINVKKYKIESLNNKIGYVPQKAVMFTGTVSDNVSYGDNGKEKPTIEKIKEAISVAQGTDFVSKMDGMYEAHIARGGTNVSGGQKQRLAIARAIARDPEIYIFDDSFSALDYKTDAILRKELKKYTKDATSIIVAQRIGTIMNADKIIVLDKGECVGIGTHKELLKNCDVYKEIALSQLSEEELKDA